MNLVPGDKVKLTAISEVILYESNNLHYDDVSDDAFLGHFIGAAEAGDGLCAG